MGTSTAWAWEHLTFVGETNQGLARFRFPACRKTLGSCHTTARSRQGLSWTSHTPAVSRRGWLQRVAGRIPMRPGRTHPDAGSGGSSLRWPLPSPGSALCPWETGLRGTQTGHTGWIPREESTHLSREIQQACSPCAFFQVVVTGSGEQRAALSTPTGR